MGYLTETEIEEMLEVCKDMVAFMNEHGAGLNQDDYKGAWKLLERGYDRLEKEHTDMLKTLRDIAHKAAVTAERNQH